MRQAHFGDSETFRLQQKTFSHSRNMMDCSSDCVLVLVLMEDGKGSEAECTAANDVVLCADEASMLSDLVAGAGGRM